MVSPCKTFHYLTKSLIRLTLSTPAYPIPMSMPASGIYQKWWDRPLNSTHRLCNGARPERIFARVVVQSAM